MVGDEPSFFQKHDPGWKTTPKNNSDPYFGWPFEQGGIWEVFTSRPEPYLRHLCVAAPGVLQLLLTRRSGAEWRHRMQRDLRPHAMIADHAVRTAAWSALGSTRKGARSAFAYEVFRGVFAVHMAGFSRRFRSLAVSAAAKHVGASSCLMPISQAGHGACPVTIQ